MKTNQRKLAAGLAAVALLAAGPIAAADARGGGGGGGGGGVIVQPRPIQQPPQLPQLPQLPPLPQLPGLPQLPQPVQPVQHPVPEPGDVGQVKVLRLLHTCRGNLPLARGGLEYEVFPLNGATMLSVEIDNGPRNTPVTFVVDGTTLGTLTTDAFGDARWIDTSGALVPTVTSLVQISDARGVVVGTSC